MKKIILISSLLLLAMSCNMNPSKEGRIQQLETQMEQISKKIIILETTVNDLSIENKQLKIKVDSLQMELAHK